MHLAVGSFFTLDLDHLGRRSKNDTFCWLVVSLNWLLGQLFLRFMCSKIRFFFLLLLFFSWLSRLAKYSQIRCFSSFFFLLIFKIRKRTPNWHARSIKVSSSMHIPITLLNLFVFIYDFKAVLYLLLVNNGSWYCNWYLKKRHRWKCKILNSSTNLACFYKNLTLTLKNKMKII